MNKNDFQAMRREYMQTAFDEKDAADNPFLQFKQWFDKAEQQPVDMPNAMTLATATSKGKPSLRTVLLKEYDEQGFVFFTNYQSSKAQDLETNPQASLLFYWQIFDRQIRIEGTVKRVSREDSENYFKSRPIDSQISAIISNQSTEVESRLFLENRFTEVKNKSDSGIEITTPENWGGYCLVPNYFEFWQGKENRLHDRIVYSELNGTWKIKRLAP
jgi:pyridoxamine-phosphate oxidase